jgi:hypothetical protein
MHTERMFSNTAPAVQRLDHKNTEKERPDGC